MDTKTLAHTKDKMLDIILAVGDKFNVEQFAKDNNLSNRHVTALLKQFKSLGFVELKPMTKSKGQDYEPFGLVALSEGAFFLNIEGGFIQSYKSQRRHKIWTVTKIISNVASTIIIIFIAAIGVYLEYCR